MSTPHATCNAQEEFETSSDNRFGKPIVIIVEEEGRFFAWDADRWRNDQCTRKEGTTSEWTSGWLQNIYAEVEAAYPEVVELIEAHLDAGTMIPYRRRDFEADAMARELVRRASTAPHVVFGAVHRARSVPAQAISPVHVHWGTVLPPSQAERTAQLDTPRMVRIIADTQAAGTLVKSLKGILSSLSHKLEFAPDVNAATHALVVLTGSMLKEGSLMENELCTAMEKGCSGVFVYSTSDGWDFGKFYARPESEAKNAVASHEALVFRSKMEHEQRAMALELLRRMRPTAAQPTDTIRPTESEVLLNESSDKDNNAALYPGEQTVAQSADNNQQAAAASACSEAVLIAYA